MNYFELIDNIFKENKGYITRKEIDKANIPSIYLSRFAKKHDLVQVERGFYAKKDWIVDPYLIFQYTYPKFIYSYNSAIYLNKLGDILPNYLEVTGPLNYRPFSKNNNELFLHTDTREETFNLGIAVVKTNLGNEVRAYDVEKTICDFIRNKEKMDFEIYIKLLHNYKKRSDKDVNKLMSYAKIMKIEDKVREIMEVLINED